MKYIIKRVIIYLLIGFFIFWLPFIFILFKTKSDIITDINKLPLSDVSLVFGANITEDGKLTPLLKERVEAGKVLWQEDISKYLVVSNTFEASQIMSQYLLDNGVPSDNIEIDSNAATTPDTCISEKEKYPDNRKIIFLTQGYHLPRTIYQCKKLGVEGVGFPAENLEIIDRSEYSLLTKLSIRIKRYFREATLDWLVVLNLYHY